MEFGELSLYGNTIKLWAAFGLCGPVISTCDRGNPLPVRGCPGCRDPAQLFHSLASMPLSCKRAPFNCCDGRFSFFPIYINGLGSLADPCLRSEFQSIPRYCKAVKILGSVFPLVPNRCLVAPSPHLQADSGLWPFLRDCCSAPWKSQATRNISLISGSHGWAGAAAGAGLTGRVLPFTGWCQRFTARNARVPGAHRGVGSAPPARAGWGQGPGQGLAALHHQDAGGGPTEAPHPGCSSFSCFGQSW